MNSNTPAAERKVNVWRVEWAMSAEGRWWPQAKVFLSEQAAEHFTREAKLYPRRYACLRIVPDEQEMPTATTLRSSLNSTRQA